MTHSLCGFMDTELIHLRRIMDKYYIKNIDGLEQCLSPDKLKDNGMLHLKKKIDSFKEDISDLYIKELKCGTE